MKLLKLFKEIGRNSYVDWIVVLILTTAVALTLAFGGFYLYNALVHGDIGGSDASTSVTPKKINEKSIGAVVERYAEREVVRNKALSGYSGVRDPSL